MPNQKRVTLATVAQEAGCSTTTVSLVLNGRGKELGIKDETAKRVLDAAKRLELIPNEMARSLQRRRSRVIGVIFLHLRNDFAENIMRGVRRVLRANDRLPFLTSHDEDAHVERTEIQRLLARQLEALICEPLLDSDGYKMIQRAHIPLVILGSSLEDHPEISYVAWDTFNAARSAVLHLRETGRHKIGFISEDDDRPTFIDRRRGYIEGLKDAGLEMNPGWMARVHEQANLPSVMSLMFQDKKNRPDALLAATDALGIQAIETIEALGLRVPEDVALVGMGGGPFCSHPHISLTTVDAPTEEMGAQAAITALELIQESGTTAKRRLITQNAITPRRTSLPKT